MPTNLMGLDVGFSKTQRTTGIACLRGDQLSLERAGTSRESRKAKIPHGFRPSVIAIDGPLLPLGADQHVRRHVESVFIRAPFHNRCRPGLSHHGVGLGLRAASIPTARNARDSGSFSSMLLALAPDSCLRHGITPPVAR
jgi:hypothetical protein